MGDGNADVAAKPLKCVILKHTESLCAELHGTAYSVSSSMIKIEDQSMARKPQHHLQCNVSSVYL